VYSAAINTFSKRHASVFASFSVLSYVATVVMSAKSGCSYLFGIWGAQDGVYTECATAGVIMFVAFMNIWGLKESTRLAQIIFMFHGIILTMLLFWSVVWISMGHTKSLDNLFSHPLPHTWPVSFLFGFSTGMLGITGFETACNYIEQQQQGVYEKALRNMWVLVALVNPLISFFCLGVMDVDYIYDHRVLSYHDCYLNSRGSGRSHQSHGLKLDWKLSKSGIQHQSWLRLCSQFDRSGCVYSADWLCANRVHWSTRTDCTAGIGWLFASVSSAGE